MWDLELPRKIIEPCRPVLQPAGFLRSYTTDEGSSANDKIKIRFNHGTTTLAFKFKHGVIIAVDSRATAGSYIGMLASWCLRSHPGWHVSISFLRKSAVWTETSNR